MPSVLTVNLARPRPNPDKESVLTGIDKLPTDDAVAVRPPGPRKGGLGSGMHADLIGNKKLHGGDDQAVYAYAREDLDDWQTRLGRTLSNGNFGENLTTSGVDVTGARVGERWHVGSDGLVLEVTSPRTPCRTFAAFLDLPGWMKTFTRAAIPGAYLRVISPGTVRAGDDIVVADRPDHERHRVAGLSCPSHRARLAAPIASRRRAAGRRQGARAAPRSTTGPTVTDDTVTTVERETRRCRLYARRAPSQPQRPRPTPGLPVETGDVLNARASARTT